MVCLSRPFLKRLLVTIVLMASFSTVAGLELDIDGDCESKPLSDGLLLIR